MSFLVTRFFVVALLVGLVVASPACRRRSATKPANQGEIISQPGPATTALGASEARIPTQEDVYQATRKFMDRNKREARTPEELVAAGLLAPLPAPPLGKKYVLDQRAAVLIIVDN